jgi:SSS family transporter
MRTIDWVVLAASLVGIVSYGLWRGRGSDTVDKYLRAGRSMPWYAIALSIMATQASAITFISTTGQGYVDGMRFVQFYFGLPIAMVLISAFAVPIFHRADVYTAYEYLERRFDAKTRVLVSVVFLISRGLAAGVVLYAPAVVLTVILGWPDYITTLIMGILVMIYTVMGGIQAVTWTDFQQMLIMMGGLVVAFITAILLLPDDVSFMNALTLAGAGGKLNPIVWEFDWNDRYNVWSGILGGLFLFLAYFGADQSQVQRYLTGRSIAQSRIGLLFNGVAKVPMQFFILLTGAVVFVFFVYEKPPVLFQPVELARLQQTPEFAGLQQRFDSAFEARKKAAELGDHAAFRESNTTLELVRREAAKLTGANDTNYVFLSFVTQYMPVGIVGLVMAAIFAAAMSTTSAEINALATVTVVDIYRRHFKRDATDLHYVRASRVATLFWGVYAIGTAQFGASLGSLVEAVNMVGSFFYPSLIGVFILAFFFKQVGGTAAFIAVLIGEAFVFGAHFSAEIGFLWYNLLGCAVVVGTGLAIAAYNPQKA